MNQSTDYIYEHGEAQFSFLEESRPEDFVLSFEQNITEPLITAEFDELKGYFSSFAQISSDVDEELERYLVANMRTILILSRVQSMSIEIVFRLTSAK
jgi:hypothetical protein